ncbi:hypothetical protein ACHAW5_007214 [Stephanodiscus triporus]|uniref:Uncharacterized protein n=1 Tax=Stephanodiscus triporus TaxID=2934178 RepID=A0ABD3MFU1_9STRA
MGMTIVEEEEEEEEEEEDTPQLIVVWRDCPPIAVIVLGPLLPGGSHGVVIGGGSAQPRVAVRCSGDGGEDGIAARDDGFSLGGFVGIGARTNALAASDECPWR